MGHPKKKEQKRTTLNKETLIKALENNMGNVTLACHFSGVARSTFYRYEVYPLTKCFVKVY